MKRLGIFAVALCCTAAGPFALAGEPSFKELLEQTLPGMGAQEIPDRQESQQKFQTACYAVSAPGHEAERAEACKLIAQHLGPETAKPARIWLLKQLEFIGHGECVAAIMAQLSDKDPEIADAARRALENNPDMSPVIDRGGPSDYLPRPGRLAKMQGALVAAGDKAAAMVTKMLASEDADDRAIAAGYVGNITDAAATGLFVVELPKLPPAGQVLLLGALAAKGDKAAGPAAVAAAKSENMQVKIAALRALATLGDASAVPVLIEAVAAGGETAGAAKESLQAVWGQGVDEAIIASVQNAQPPLRDTLLDVLEYRGAPIAVPVFLQLVQGGDAKLRARAMRALGKLAEPENVPVMIRVLLNIEKGAARDDAEKAIMLVCNRAAEEDQRAEPVLAALAGANDAQRTALLPLLGRIGGKPALAVVETAMQSETVGIREAGIRGLCNWPDQSVADRLLDLAKTSDNPTYSMWALRGYIRIITLDSKRLNKKSLRLFEKAMTMATRDDERNLVLSRVYEVRDVETLRWVLPYLDNPALASEASRAVVELAHRREIMEPHQAEFLAALKKVTEVCKKPDLVDRARRTMEGL
jgi:HEAT repeat protein